MELRRSFAATLLIFSVSAGTESANLKRADVGGDAGAARELAISVCDGCHAAPEDQSFALTDSPDVLTIPKLISRMPADAILQALPAGAP